MHYEVSVIVEGALDETITFPDDVDAEDWACKQAKELREKSLAYDIYVLEHFCDLEDEESECVCAQYAQDHHPAYSSQS